MDEDFTIHVVEYFVSGVHGRVDGITVMEDMRVAAERSETLYEVGGERGGVLIGFDFERIGTCGVVGDMEGLVVERRVGSCFEGSLLFVEPEPERAVGGGFSCEALRACELFGY